MSEELNTIQTVDTSPFKHLIMTIGELPTSFVDSMSYYECMAWLVNYIQNTVIPAVNNNAAATQELQDMVVQMKQYMDNYFDNLDVQQEIDNKLDEMFANGQLDLLFSKYVNAYVEATNEKLDALDDKVDSLNDLAPEVVSSTDDMTDNTKIYLNTGDGYWYYYNGTQFVQGGLYNSDATDSAIKWYLNDVASDGNDMINPFTCAVGGLKTADGAYDATQTSYWVTDYIPVDPSKIPDYANNYWFASFSCKNEPVQKYKVCYYASDKSFIQAHSGADYREFLGNSTDISNFAYMRIQFANTAVAFADRYYVSATQPTPPHNISGIQLASRSRYTAIDTDGIKAGTIENTRLSENLYQSNFYQMLKNEINPFNISDIGYGTIETATGSTIWRTQKDRLESCKIVKVPAGTTITLSNDWKLLAFSYSINDTYLGRFYNDWGTTIFFPTDTRVRFVFKNETIGTIANLDAVKNLISNISISKSEGTFEYSGERLSVKNKFSADNTGLTTYGQDGACYGNNYITFNNSGYYMMYTMNGDLLKSSTALDQVATYAPHANAVCFGTEKYDEGDTYPLLYVNAYNTAGLPQGACYVYRLLNNMTTSLQQQILINFTGDPIWAGDGHSVRPYGNFIVDTDNNKLYVYVMIDSLNVTRFFKFDLPELSDGAIVRLEKTDILEYFDIPWMYYMQGACYFNGKIYASCGFTSADCKLYAVDLTNKNVTSVVPLGGFIGEPETVFVYNDELYVSSTSSLFKLHF